MAGAAAKRKQYRLGDGKWSIDWDGFQSVVRRRMVATGNFAAIQSGTKSVSGGIALFGKELEEIDIDFDGIRAQAQKTSESLIESLRQTCADRQQTGEGLRGLICAECAADYVHASKFKQRLGAINQKNMAKIRAADATWGAATEVTKLVRDLSVDAFFSLGAIVVPAPAAWKAGHIAVKASIAYYLDDEKAKKVGTNASADVVNFVVTLLPVPKTGKLALEVFVNSSKDAVNATFDGKPLAEAVVTSLMTNVAETGAKQILSSGEFQAWLSKKVIPARVERSGLAKLGTIGHAERRDLVGFAGGLPGEVTVGVAKVGIGAIDMANGSVKQCGSGCADVNPEQFRPIANSIVASSN